MVDKAKKIQQVEELKAAFSESATVVVANFKALTIKESDELRKVAKKNGANVRVAKNTLTEIASKGTRHESITAFLNGQTLVAYSKDPVAAAKTIVDFAKKNEKLSVAGGSFDGAQLNQATVTDLANTPSLDQSRAKIVGLLVASAGQIARISKEPAAQLARVFAAYGRKEG